MPFLEENGEKYYDWMNAHTYDSNINLLPVRLASLSSAHKDITREEIAIDACHEFVHICQAKASGINSTQNSWFWEALATNLGNPERFEWGEPKSRECVYFDEICNIDDLEKAIESGSYQYAYLVGNYLLGKIPHKQILNYVQDENILDYHKEQILSDVKLFYQNCATELEQDKHQQL